MKSLIFLMLLVSHVSFGIAEYREPFKHISNADFHARFKVKGEFFILDSTGAKLLAPTTETHEWQPGAKGELVNAIWDTIGRGFNDIAVRHTWKIGTDNSLTVTIKQYEHSDLDIAAAIPKKRELGKLIREETIKVQNFAPVTWVAETAKDYSVVLRFTPEVSAEKDEQALDRLPIGGDRGTFIVSDNQGNLWGDNVRLGGVFAGITCHRGTLIISFYPFDGAKPMGFATGNTIQVNPTDNLKVKFTNDNNLIPDGMKTTVYGRYYPKIKTGSVNSVSSYGQREFKGFPKEFQ